MFHLAIPYFVGRPDISRQPRPRRCRDPDPAWINLVTWVQMAASNCLARFRWDWDLLPGAWPLHFASDMNTMTTLSLKRALRRSSADKVMDADLNKHNISIYKKLWKGEYIDNSGRRVSAKGDVSKVSQTMV